MLSKVQVPTEEQVGRSRMMSLNTHMNYHSSVKPFRAVITERQISAFTMMCHVSSSSF